MANEIAYGFVGLQSLFNRRVNQVGIAQIRDAIAASAAEHTQLMNAITAAMVERTTAAQEEFLQPGTGTLQPLDEMGIPRVRDEFNSYQVAYPIQGGGDAWGANRVTSQLLTVEEVNDRVVNIQNADADWIARHIMAALLDNTTWTFHDKVGPNGAKGLGNITIQPLANGDTVTYVRRGLPAATADHFTAQAAAIDDSNNPMPDIYKTLTRYPVPGADEVVAYVGETTGDQIEALSDFNESPDPDVAPGTSTDVLTGTTSIGFGDELLGKVNKVWVVLWRRLPDGYILAHNRGAGAPLKMREYPAAELQGLFSEVHSPDGARIESRMIRYAGFGAANRIAAMVHHVGNASYVIPTDYATPLAQ